MTRIKDMEDGTGTIPPVRLQHALPRPHRLAFALALLAVVAQLWMAQLSTTHLAQRVGLQAFWGEICTAYNSPYTTADTSDPSMDGNDSDTLPNTGSCPVCSAAAASFVPLAAPARLPSLPMQTLHRQGSADHPAPALRHASLRPPAQAPPAA